MISVLVTSNIFNDCCAEPNQALPMYTDFNLTGTAAVVTPDIVIGDVAGPATPLMLTVNATVTARVSN